MVSRSERSKGIDRLHSQLATYRGEMLFSYQSSLPTDRRREEAAANMGRASEMIEHLYLTSTSHMNNCLCIDANMTFFYHTVVLHLLKALVEKQILTPQALQMLSGVLTLHTFSWPAQELHQRGVHNSKAPVMYKLPYSAHNCAVVRLEAEVSHTRRAEASASK